MDLIVDGLMKTEAYWLFVITIVVECVFIFFIPFGYWFIRLIKKNEHTSWKIIRFWAEAGRDLAVLVGFILMLWLILLERDHNALKMQLMVMLVAHGLVILGVRTILEFVPIFAREGACATPQKSPSPGNSGPSSTRHNGEDGRPLDEIGNLVKIFFSAGDLLIKDRLGKNVLPFPHSSWPKSGREWGQKLVNESFPDGAASDGSVSGQNSGTNNKS